MTGGLGGWFTLTLLLGSANASPRTSGRLLRLNYIKEKERPRHIKGRGQNNDDDDDIKNAHPKHRTRRARTHDGNDDAIITRTGKRSRSRSRTRDDKCPKFVTYAQHFGDRYEIGWPVSRRAEGVAQ